MTHQSGDIVYTFGFLILLPSASSTLRMRFYRSEELIKLAVKMAKDGCAGKRTGMVQMHDPRMHQAAQVAAQESGSEFLNKHPECKLIRYSDILRDEWETAPR